MHPYTFPFLFSSCYSYEGSSQLTEIPLSFFKLFLLPFLRSYALFFQFFQDLCLWWLKPISKEWFPNSFQTTGLFISIIVRGFKTVFICCLHFLTPHSPHNPTQINQVYISISPPLYRQSPPQCFHYSKYLCDE